jgi:hypothetical protein
MVCLHISAKIDQKLNHQRPLAINRTSNRMAIRTQNRTCRRPLTAAPRTCVCPIDRSARPRPHLRRLRLRLDAAGRVRALDGARDRCTSWQPCCWLTSCDPRAERAPLAKLPRCSLALTCNYLNGKGFNAFLLHFVIIRISPICRGQTSCSRRSGSRPDMSQCEGAASTFSRALCSASAILRFSKCQG